MTQTRCTWAGSSPLMIEYHDQEWGVPAHDDRVLFEYLVLDGAQAGLSWETVLKKREHYRRAFDAFDPAKIVSYGDIDIERLLADPGIIRNRLKVDAAIANAGRILELRETHGSFAVWLAAHHPRSKEEWVKLFKKTFRFTGGEIVGEFLMSIGYLPGAHAPSCPVYSRILERRPAWSR